MQPLKDILLPIVTGVVRNFLQAIFGWMIASHWLTAQPEHQDSLALYITGFFFVTAWSVYQKLRAWLRQRLALALPSGSSAAELAAAMKNNSIPAAIAGALQTDVPIQKP